jgi:PTH1 family peptidyl-tRNA hydrolase
MTTAPVALKLVAGLGNPGSRHAGTRHNAGFWFVDRLARARGATFMNDAKLFGQLARLKSDGRDLHLFKPQTYMNESGRAIQSIMAYYKILPAEMLVVHDEIDLPPGVVRLKRGGGHAGHNGLRDIIDRIGSRDFNRLRIGVGHPGDKERVIGAVLGKPTRAEKKLIDAAIDAALESMPLILAGEFNKAMTILHTNNMQLAASGEY